MTHQKLRDVIHEVRVSGWCVVLGQALGLARYAMQARRAGSTEQSRLLKNSKELVGLRAGDRIAFRLHVTETESWIGQIGKIGTVALGESKEPASPLATQATKAEAGHPLLAFNVTNELCQAVSLRDFRSDALPTTCVFTRSTVSSH